MPLFFWPATPGESRLPVLGESPQIRDTDMDCWEPVGTQKTKFSEVGVKFKK